MDQEKGQYEEPLFPSPYELFEVLIADDLRLRKELEEELRRLKLNYQPPKSYKLELHPPGTRDGKQNKNFDGAIAKLENEIKDTENRIVSRVDRECKELELDKEQVKIIDNVVFEKMFPDPFKGLGPHELKAYNSKSKDMDEAQQSMYYRLKRNSENRLNKNSKSKDSYSPDKD